MDLEQFLCPAGTPIYLGPGPLEVGDTSAQVGLWAERIKQPSASFAGTMETGQVLSAAKAALPHDKWLLAVEEARLHPRTAQMWMRIARNPRFVNASSDSLLPASPVTLDAISRLPDDEYQRLLADGVINPAVSGATIREHLSKLKQAADEESVKKLAPVAAKVRTLVGDPGWELMRQGGRACPYKTMS